MKEKYQDEIDDMKERREEKRLECSRQLRQSRAMKLANEIEKVIEKDVDNYRNGIGTDRGRRRLATAIAERIEIDKDKIKKVIGKDLIVQAKIVYNDTSKADKDVLVSGYENILAEAISKADIIKLKAE